MRVPLMRNWCKHLFGADEMGGVVGRAMIVPF